MAFYRVFLSEKKVFDVKYIDELFTLAQNSLTKDVKFGDVVLRKDYDASSMNYWSGEFFAIYVGDSENVWVEKEFRTQWNFSPVRHLRISNEKGSETVINTNKKLSRRWVGAYLCKPFVFVEVSTAYHPIYAWPWRKFKLSKSLVVWCMRLAK